MVGAPALSRIESHRWIVKLPMIFLGCYFAADAGNGYLEWGILRPPVMLAGAGTAVMVEAPLPLGPPQPYLAMAARNLFDARRELRLWSEDPEGPGRADVPDRNDLRPCSLAVSVRGTLVAQGAPRWSLVVVGQGRESDLATIHPGSNLIGADATLVEIRDRAIVVRRAGHYELCLADGDQEEASRSPRRSPPAPSIAGVRVESPLSEHVRSTGAGSWEVDQTYLQEEVFGDLAHVVQQIHVVPSFKGGQPHGFKVIKIKPHTFFTAIGLHRGDVIRQVNGYDLDSPAIALELFQKLKTADSVELILSRRGTPLTFRYTVR